MREQLCVNEATSAFVKRAVHCDNVTLRYEFLLQDASLVIAKIERTRTYLEIFDTTSFHSCRDRYSRIGIQVSEHLAMIQIDTHKD